MAILHGIWVRSTFHLWAEAQEEDSLCPPSPEIELAGESGNDHQGIHQHPTALSTADLHATVGELSPDGLLASIAEESCLSLWLPAIDDRPVPSFEHGCSCDDYCLVDTELRPFVVPTLALAPAETIDLLTGVREPLPRNCGESIRYWHRLADYVGSLLTRQRFVPDIAERLDGTLHAMWRVLVPERQELQGLQSYASAMPPICRAVAGVDEHDADPIDIAESFVQECTDSVVRRCLSDDPFFHNIHDQASGESPWEVRWLSALLGENRVIRRRGESDVEMARQVHAWVSKIDEEHIQVPPKLCLELVEPFDPDDEQLGDLEVQAAPSEQNNDNPAPRERWRIRLHLQATDGSGEFYDISRVWKDKATGPTILTRHVANRREHLANELARAAESFPQLEKVLSSEAPTEIELTTGQAHRFLREHGPLLEAQGFGVMLPIWAGHRERQLGLRLTVRPRNEDDTLGPPGAGVLGLNTIVSFEWRVAIGDTDLSLSEFEGLRDRGEPLVKIGNEWVQFDARGAQDASDYITSRGQGNMTLAQAIRCAYGVDTIDAGLPVVGIDGADWLEQLLNTAPSARLEAMEQPVDFKGTMRPYQLRGLSWLAFIEQLGMGGCLADDMGLGKTIQLIALLLAERQDNKQVGPTLIFSPMSVVGNWQREFEKFAPSLRVTVHHGPDRLSDERFLEQVKSLDAVITTYALGHRDLSTLKEVGWHRIALDEAQKIKNPSAAQTIAIRSLESTYRIALTGTPLENYLSELWSIMEMLNPGLLGSAGGFRKKFAVPIERLGDQERAQQLRKLIRPFMLRRAKSDPSVECDLPEKMEMKVYCNLTPEQAALYERIVAELLSEVETASGIRRRGVILAALTKLKQVCNHPTNYLRDDTWLDGRSGKCERLVEMLEEVLAEGDAALIYTQYREMGDLLHKMLTERLHTEVPFLHGGCTAKKRQQMIDQFQDSGNQVKLFLLSLRAGGLGLNLTAANHVFHFDRWWNPAVEDQATDRAHRVGQTQRVQVHKFVCIGTIEERIDKLLTEKIALAENIVGSGDEWLTGLTTEELAQYLRLSRDAVGDN